VQEQRRRVTAEQHLVQVEDDNGAHAVGLGQTRSWCTP
jgi:hypothetical protein